MSIKIDLYHLQMPLKQAMKSSQATVAVRDTILVRFSHKNFSGWGECPAFTTPFYSAETIATAWAYLKKFFDTYQNDLSRGIAFLRNFTQKPDRLENSMSIHAILSAYESMLLAQKNYSQSLVQYYVQNNIQGDLRAKSLDLGLVLWAYPFDIILEKIEAEPECRRFKLKIGDVNDICKIVKLRELYHHLKLAVDANGIFTIDNLSELQELDNLDLDFIEEPFNFKTWQEVKNMQDHFKTPLCYDESVQSIADLESMHEMQAGNMVNIKICKFGGLKRTMDILNRCQSLGIKFMYGNMVETGIGKIQQSQLASLVPSTVIGDLSDSQRYFVSDLISPDITFVAGKYLPPQNLSLNVDENLLAKFIVKHIYYEGVYHE